MMKLGLILLVVAVVTIGASFADESAAPVRRIAFSRNSSIWIKTLDGARFKKLVSGADPCISRDGNKVAFTFTPPGATGPTRYIAVADISTGTTTTFKETPSDNCYGPKWSPDGLLIMFEIFIDNQWRVGLLRADGSGFRFLNLPPRSNAGWCSLCWAPDGQSIFCQDLKDICRFRVSGELIRSWEIDKLFPDGDLDSGSHFSICGDGKRLLIDVNMSNEEPPKDFNGPPPAIWLLEVESGKVGRLTPKGSYAIEPCWLSDSEYLFVDVAREEGLIYRTTITGESRKLVVRNAADPSVSR
jgi:TolB protein